jgi:hypothetical protein
VDWTDHDYEEVPRRLLVQDIDELIKREYVMLIHDGLDPGTAARELGSTGSQFRKLRSPNSHWYDPAFADQVAAALASEDRRHNRVERLEEAFWAAVEAGEKWAVEKGLYAYHPDFEQLRHTNLRVSGEIVHAAKVLLPHLSDDEIRARIADIEAREYPQLPAPK